MSIKWTAERDQKLLMLNIKAVKMDYQVMASLWAEEFRNFYRLP